VSEDQEIIARLGGIPPGHPQSPYPSDDDIERASRVLASPPGQLPDLDLNAGEQLELVEALAGFQDEAGFPRTAEPGWRYHSDNDFFPHADAIALYSMMRHLRPRRLVEVGAGFSSAAILDTNERFLEDAVDCTFIDPRPNRLRSLLRDGELERLTVLATPVQDVPVSVFESLLPNDILFVDSSHVSKAGSDVNHIFFELLPRLAGGVHVHFHDVQYPFTRTRWSEPCRDCSSQGAASGSGAGERTGYLELGSGATRAGSRARPRGRPARAPCESPAIRQA
jgi:methyltransferase family protein